ncbi:RhoGAP domain containing protein [Trichomonas vaginalis G3]|uniref:RhoGAP domain containing protein n=1 Tax=Trichomonas vaginalis (strain ATCC PRA-98 / G3) TaxID=412133 RepID=A2E3G6_TRIV3|nr:GTPase activator protein [Trichomonas vaginalis G3]XP_001325080.1 GTPase activator protein [Trichomonas vaginalis G3]EAX95633.1 RhoGAP domain containing protein [Trichomonas vaginalis G3]EAY12857.1 RhoGAP domain containing protein [Trichomonas vaginalis G3]KAI5487434.1 GTPase activator protein [Trichomonas vaginalis G3]KAI5488486.1 GTPase activator protein [Trichomonas vaginalis G3]|eukprot:XP_001308563.1 RhoGAP domain containing protein [Trichomonas vaginalis G3]
MYATPSLQGKPLQSLHLTEDGVPAFVPECTSFIKKFAKTVGVFRINGNKYYIEELYHVLNHKEVAIPPCCQVHDVSGFLKNWLMNIPEPILIPEVFNQYYVELREESIYDVIKNLPQINRKCLAYIFSAINEVFINAHVNQMSMANISTCFQTCLTQDSTRFHNHVPFPKIFQPCVKILNETGSDFDIPDM